MKKEDVEEYKDKKVRVVLNNKFTYNCEITSISESAIKIKDMYNNLLTIDLSFIAMICPIGGKNA